MVTSSKNLLKLISSFLSCTLSSGFSSLKLVLFWKGYLVVLDDLELEPSVELKRLGREWTYFSSLE